MPLTPTCLKAVSSLEPPMSAHTDNTAPRLPPKLTGLMLAFVLTTGLGIYVWVGHPAAWQVGPGSADPPQAQLASAAQASGETQTDRLNALIGSLIAKLKAQPDDADALILLARAYTALERFDDAVPVYKKATALRPNDAQLHADHADALAMKQGSKLDGEPAALIAKALKLDPRNFKALYLSGAIAFEKQDFHSAADQWARAAEQAPPDDADASTQIQAALQVARQRAGQAQPAADTPASVSGVVSLSRALQDQVSPEDTVFIFARAAQGPKMPLAVLRKQVKDLPVRFSLTDAMAMSPQMKLSGFAEVVVGARVSRSGQAMPQSGDWQGLSEPVKLGSQDIRIEIAQPVR